AISVRTPSGERSCLRRISGRVDPPASSSTTSARSSRPIPAWHRGKTKTPRGGRSEASLLNPPPPWGSVRTFVSLPLVGEGLPLISLPLWGRVGPFISLPL